MRPIAILFVFLAACGGASTDAQQTGETETQAGNGAERFYGRESFTLVGEQTGREAGTFTEHVRDWGRRRVEINDMTLSVAGRSLRNQTRALFDGPEIATVNLETGDVVTTSNPFYTEVVEAMRGRDGVEFGRETMTRMGGRETGESGNFAGHDCDYWEVATLGTQSCVTPWGATLRVETNLAGVELTRTVTEVRLGDGGPDAAFEVDRAQAKAAPSLQDIRAKMRGE